MSLFKIQLLLLLSFLVLACSQSSSDNPELDQTDSVIDNDRDGTAAVDDCDDNNQYVHTLNTFYRDQDLDGYGSVDEIKACALEPVSGQSLTSNDPDDTDSSITPFDQDGDGTQASADCNDLDNTLSLEMNYFADSDGDGFGAGAPLSVCSNIAPAGYVLSSSDPDDANPLAVPDDTDGDGIANNGDCNPTNSQEYLSQVYYVDSEGDGIGSGDPVNMCVYTPIPALDGYSLITGDSCPDHINSNKDFDEDNIDDICDMEIRLLSDKVISGDESIAFSTSLNGNKTFYFGDASHPVTVEFNESARLAIDNNTTLHLEGGSRLVFNKTLYNKTPHLSLANTSFSGAGRIVGIGDDNQIHFFASDLFFDNGTEFDGIEQVFITTKTLYDPVKRQDVEYTSLFHYELSELNYLNGRSYVANAEQAPTIKNSPGEWALLVRDQMLEVSPIRFLNNEAYPVRCDGDGFYGEESQNVTYSTCQYAAYSRYEGNLFNGPLLSVVYTNKLPSQDYLYAIEMEPLSIGTKTLYIQAFSVHVLDGTARSINFHNYTIKAAHAVGKDSSGTMIDWGLPSHPNAIPFFRVYNSGAVPLAYINFFNSDVTEVPLIIDGGKIVADGSQLGTVLFPYGTLSSNVFGEFYAYNYSTLDFSSSPYVVTDGINNFGLGIPGNFYGYIQIGRDIGENPVDTQDLIISDGTIHIPILDGSAMTLAAPNATDFITGSNFKLTKSVGFVGIDVDTVFSQDSSAVSISLKLK